MVNSPSHGILSLPMSLCPYPTAPIMHPYPLERSLESCTGVPCVSREHATLLTQGTPIKGPTIVAVEQGTGYMDIGHKETGVQLG